MSPRIQRMMMKLQRYDLNLVYTPGKHIIVADALSRAPMLESCHLSEEVEGHVSTVISSLPFSDEMLKLIVEETTKDAECALCTVTSAFILRGRVYIPASEERGCAHLVPVEQLFCFSTKAHRGTGVKSIHIHYSGRSIDTRV